MSQVDVKLAYDADRRRAVLTFPNGRTLAVGNVTQAQAQSFLQRNSAEFMKRDCCLHTVDGTFTRDGEHE
jgi:hypothetical protein